MDAENRIAELTAKLNELNAARAADTARLETKMQEILSAMQAVQEEIRTLTADESTIIAFS
ncbi:MAG: hypothetical protein IKZ31_04460 [Lentisphaeria bacterium]|nr:hypothetical protein [Lentisphaeria bacterium]